MVKNKGFLELQMDFKSDNSKPSLISRNNEIVSKTFPIFAQLEKQRLVCFSEGQKIKIPATAEMKTKTVR
jgi:hypothetical protein